MWVRTSSDDRRCPENYKKIAADVSGVCLLGASGMSLNVVAERDFVAADQEHFAAVCGDRNPIHMDPVAARRTLVGFPVVHGVHALLWSLDSLFRYLPKLAPVASIQVSFEKLIYVGDRVQAVLAHHDKQRLRVEILVEGIRALRLEVALGDPRSNHDTGSNEPLFQPTEPLILTFEQMVKCHGRVPFFSVPNTLCRMFPVAADALGVQRVAGLACSSFLVGMVCPGFHSIYRGLNLFTALLRECDYDALQFRVAHSDPRFKLVRLAVSGGGWVGSLDAHARPEPTAQPDLPSIATRVMPGEFSNASALVVGGSRGLGELISKIVAVGGGHVTLTYSVGEADARRVQAEITAYGGSCDVIHYDVRLNARDQISRLSSYPSQVYYLPTPVISRRKSALFSQQRFQEFLTFYVTGFYDLCRELRLRIGKELSILYPSSVYIDSRPDGMTEYAMAKAAGEVLCADIQTFESPGRILVRRLPRLPTDQTASLVNIATAEPISVILPIVREVHAIGAEGNTPN
jgi:acyl dehydratase